MPRRRTLDLAGTIGCIDTRGLKTTLISTVGTHCDVWRTTRMVSREGGALMLDLVIKRPKLAVSHAEIRIMRRDWKILHDRLGDIVPEAIFVETEVQGSPNVVVVAEAAPLWFNVANPAYEEDAVMRQVCTEEYRQAVLKAARHNVEISLAWHTLATWTEDGKERIGHFARALECSRAESLAFPPKTAKERYAFLHTEADCLYEIGRVHFHEDSPDAARRFLTEALPLAQGIRFDF